MSKIRINPEDIVGKVYGSYKVNRYVGSEKQIASRKCNRNNLIYRYEVECVKCGRKRISQRSTILNSYAARSDCLMCFAFNNVHKIIDPELFAEYHVRAMDTWRKNKQPSKDNASTGIKHYSISQVSNGYVHRISINVDKVKYVLLVKYTKQSNKLPDAIRIADELNEIISQGKDQFRLWYENNFAENQKRC